MKTISLLIIILILCACTSTNINEKEEFTVDLNSQQIHLGEIDLQLDRVFGGLRREPVTVILFPREDAVCLTFRHDIVTYHQFWSRDGRELFLEALAQYNLDFTARTIESQNARRTRQIYGVVEGFLIWRTHRLSTQASANMDIGLGYAFKERRPYFTVYQGKAEFKEPNASQNEITISPVNMYFTRAQAAELAVFFRQSYLDEIIAQNRGGRIIQSSTEIEKDDY
ncbi:MAG: hypothetical protein LBC80_09345 [Treponema sp.]|jgi:hypothetical protein|nr:hypothetical protein [Treponema sp.]